MTGPPADGATRYAGARINRIEDPRLLTGNGTYVDDVSLPGILHACFVRSPLPRATIRGIDITAARALPGVRAVFTAADLNVDVKEQWHTSVGPESPETPRPPLAEDEVRFVGDAVALVVAESRYLAEDAVDLVVVDYEAREPVVDYTTAEQSSALVHERHGSNLIGQMAGLPASALQDVFDSAAHVVGGSIYQQAYVPVPMEGRAILVDYSAPSGELTIYSATQAPHEVRLFCSRLLGVPEQKVPRHRPRHRRRLRAEDHGPARRDVHHAGGPQGGRPAQVGGGPAGEPDRRRPVAPRTRGREDGIRRGGDHPGRPDRLRVGLRGLPDPVAGRDRLGGGGAVPRPLPGPPGQLHLQVDLHQHRRPGRLPRALAVRDPGPRDASRHRGPPDGHGPDGAAAAQPAPPRGPALQQRQRHALRPHLSDRDVRTGPGHARLPGVPPGAGRGPGGRSLPGRRPLELRGAVLARVRVLRHRGGDHPDRALGQGQRVHRRRLVWQQHRDHGRAAGRRRARASPSRTSPPSRGTPPSPGSAAARPAAAAPR